MKRDTILHEVYYGFPAGTNLEDARIRMQILANALECEVLWKFKNLTYISHAK
jgi:hypothetical protein